MKVSQLEIARALEACRGVPEVHDIVRRMAQDIDNMQTVLEDIIAGYVNPDTAVRRVMVDLKNQLEIFYGKLDN